MNGRNSFAPVAFGLAPLCRSGGISGGTAGFYPGRNHQRQRDGYGVGGDERSVFEDSASHVSAAGPDGRERSSLRPISGIREIHGEPLVLENGGRARVRAKTPGIEGSTS